MSASGDGWLSPFLPNVLSGKVALVSGGGSGIGFECARQLARHGAAVVLMGRREAFLTEACAMLEQEGLRVASSPGDVRKGADCARAVEVATSAFGRLDILVNSAAGNFMSLAEKLSPGGFRTVLEIDAVGTFTMCIAALEELKRSRGCIVNITSNEKHRSGAGWFQAHAASAKSAITSMSRSLALEWGSRHGIRVNNVAPGAIADTPGLAMTPPEALRELERKIAATVPLGRMGTKQECAEACLFLCAAQYVSGQTIDVDGADSCNGGAPLLSVDEVLAEGRAGEARKRSFQPGSRL